MENLYYKHSIQKPFTLDEILRSFMGNNSDTQIRVTKKNSAFSCFKTVKEIVNENIDRALLMCDYNIMFLDEENMTEERCLEVIKSSPQAINFIPEKKWTKEMLKISLKFYMEMCTDDI